jgi:flagellar basal-body rod protein FlgG
MNNSLINSMVTMRSLQQKLDVIAQNIANVNTVGFKKREASFEDILTNVKQQPKEFQRDGRLSPPGINQGWGAKLSQTQLNLAQGSLQETSSPTDFALEGDAMFEIAQSVPGPGGTTVAQTAYTRAGSFNLTSMPNDPNFLYLTTKDGYFVKNSNDNDNPIRIPNGYNMAVDSAGNVTATKDKQPTVNVGQIKMMRVVRPQFLEQIGDNLYNLPAGMNTNAGEIVQPVNNGSKLQEKIAVHQGFLEQSNVSLSDEMSELMTVQRAFQLSSRALSSADTMMNLANNLRG